MAQTRRQLAAAAKAKTSSRFAPAFGSSDYVKDQLDSETKALRAAGSAALQKRCGKDQAKHFESPGIEVNIPETAGWTPEKSRSAQRRRQTSLGEDFVEALDKFDPDHHKAHRLSKEPR